MTTLRFLKATLFALTVGFGLVLTSGCLQESEDNTNVEIKPLFHLDSAAINKISIRTPEKFNMHFVFEKRSNDWSLTWGKRTVIPDLEKIKVLIHDLHNIQPSEVVSDDKSKWELHELTDPLATIVTVEEEGKGKVLELHIGKYIYRQVPEGPNGQMIILGKTFFRFNDDEHIYALEDFLGMRINQSFDAWRKADFLKTDSKALFRIGFSYPADSGFVVEKGNDGWTIQNRPVELSAMLQYLNQSVFRPQNVFADDFQPNSNPIYQITFEGDNMETVILDCYQDQSGHYYLHSNLNQGVYFRSDWTEILGQLFVSKKWFFKKFGM